MNDYILKELVSLNNGSSVEEIVLPKNKTLHLKVTPNINVFLYCVYSAAIIYPFDDTLALIDTIPIVSGEIYTLPNNAKTFLLESLNTSDQDLKILKIVTRK